MAKCNKTQKSIRKPQNPSKICQMPTVHSWNTWLTETKPSRRSTDKSQSQTRAWPLPWHIPKLLTTRDRYVERRTHTREPSYIYPKSLMVIGMIYQCQVHSRSQLESIAMINEDHKRKSIKIRQVPTVHSWNTWPMKTSKRKSHKTIGKHKTKRNTRKAQENSKTRAWWYAWTWHKHKMIA